MIDIGFRANRSRPMKPMYLLLQPADHKRIEYSIPKNMTSAISYSYKSQLHNAIVVTRNDRQVLHTSRHDDSPGMC